MKPAPFVYHAPESVDEVLDLLARGDDTRVLAGGQSLVPLMKFRILKPAVLVDVNRVAGLAAVEEHDGALRVGALTRQQALVDDDVAARAQPLLRAAGRHAGYLATRHRGTLGGSLAYAAPWAELTAAAVVLDATVHVRSIRGERTIAARDFFHGPHETALAQDELLTDVSFPARSPRSGGGFHEATTGHGGYLNVAAAATVALDEAGACSAAEVVLLRVAATPYRLDTAALRGSALEDDALAELDGELAGLDPPGDIEVSGSYRKRVARSLARRALLDALDAARAA